MSRVRGWSALLALLVATPLSAQRPPVRREVGVVALSTLADPALLGGGLYAALRPGRNARLAAVAVLGRRGSETVGRGELLAHFLLAPRRVRGVGLYALGGVAGVVGRGTRGYLVLGAGLESAPGRRAGWALEGGVGGGVRLTAGWRWRW